MMGRPAARAPAGLMIAAMLALAAPVAAQQQQGTRVETSQIGGERADPDAGPGKAYLDVPAPGSPATRRRGPVTSEQVAPRDTVRTTSQITAAGQSGSGMAQLSPAELDATLAQLSPAERRVLLEAIAGTDICDNPPDIAAIRTLCRNRIETRASEFTESADAPVSAEEQLLRGGVDSSGTPNVERVIERLARVSAAPDDIDNQAIASIALAPPAGTSKPDEEGDALSNLPPGTEGVINAIINQLGGATGGP